MRQIDEYNTTSNSSVYNKIRKDLITSGVLGDSHSRCPFCPIHKGCNRWFKNRKGRKTRNTKRDKRK